MSQDTMQQRAEKAYRECASDTRLLDLLTAFGQQERERAVKECAEAAKVWYVECHDDINGRQLYSSILAISKPEPLWCEHITKRQMAHPIPAVWSFSFATGIGEALQDADCWQFCPICGAPKPQASPEAGG